MVYLTDSAASALLEMCVHTPSGDAPASFNLLKIAGTDVAMEKVVPAGLPPQWVDTPEITQRIGAEWLRSHRSALLQVPSALAPETWNFLFNPLHPGAVLFQIETSYEYPFDLRLKS